MGYCQPCPLCGKTIDSKCSGKGAAAWRASFQILQIETGAPSLVKPSTTYIPAGTKEVVHSLCWLVVTKALGTCEVSPEWLRQFCEVLRDVQPFITHISFADSPEIPNKVNDIRNERSSRDLTDTNSGIFDRFSLPQEIIQEIYGQLNTYQDVFNLKLVAGVEPDARKWLTLGRQYLAYGSPFFTGSNEELSNKIKWILWGVHNHPSCFPNIVNYTTVWENIDLIRAKMGQCLFGLDTEINLAGRHVIRSTFSTSGSGQLRKKIICFGSVSTISFNFSHVLDRRYLCGFKFNGNALGYKGDSSITIPLQEFTGLRLASDGKGFIALQVRNTAWEQHWYGSDLDSGHSMFAQMEWPNHNLAEFAASFDAFKIHAISYKSDTFQSPPIWESKFPPEHLTPMVLADCHPLDGVLPFNLIDMPLGEAKAISAFVDVSTQSILGFEFTFGDTLVNIGCLHPLGTKLSFHLDFEGGEVFSGLACAEANMNHGIAVKFFTNFDRSIIFGDPTAENWRVATSPDGIFCTSNIRPSTHAGFDPISVLGVLQSQSHRNCMSIKTPQSPTWYRTTTIKFDGFDEPTTTFISMADFTAVSRITIYTETSSGNRYLCGMKVFHWDRSAEILGEARGDAQSCTLKDELTYISIYYEVNFGTRYRVKGLRFGCASHFMDAGHLEGCMSECIEVPNYHKVLYWAFNASFSYLSSTETGISLRAFD